MAKEYEYNGVKLTREEFAEKYFPKFGSRLDEVREQSKQEFLADLVEHDRELLSLYHNWLLQNTDKSECLHSIEEFLTSQNK